MPIYEQRLQNDLNQIKTAVAAMGEGAEFALNQAMQALLTGNDAIANQTILRDYPIDRQCRDIDRLCHNLIARHLPSAGHLRLISTTLRMIYDLERIADYAVNISREALDLPAPPSGLLRREMETMANTTQAMLRQAMTSFIDENHGLARSTIAMNTLIGKELDAAFSDLVREGDANCGHSREYLDLYTVFTMLERVGNRATNLCEEVIFWLTGESKAEESVNILFLDDDNSGLSVMAEAIARKGYEGQCRFASAGRIPAAAPQPHLVQFMQLVGFDLSRFQPRGIQAVDLNSIAILISLQGPVRAHIERPPFHTAYLDWDVGSLPERSDEVGAHRRFEEIYRELTLQLGQLVELVTGREGH